MDDYNEKLNDAFTAVYMQGFEDGGDAVEKENANPLLGEVRSILKTAIMVLENITDEFYKKTIYGQEIKEIKDFYDKHFD